VQDNVIIHDRRGKAIRKYSYTGEFISTHSNNLYFSFFSLLSSDEVIAYSEYLTNPDIKKHPNSNIFVFDIDRGKVNRAFLEFDDDLSLFLKITGQINNISDAIGIVYLYDYYTNSIYSYKDNTLTKEWTFDFGEKSIPAKFWETAINTDAELEKIDKGIYCSGIINFQVFDNYIIGYYSYKKNIHTFIFNTNENTICTPPFWIPKEGSDIPIFIIPAFHTDGDHLITVLQPTMIRKFIDSAPYDLQIPEELKSLDINDNPILQITKLK